MDRFYTLLDSPLGALALTSDGDALTGLYVPGSPSYAGVREGVYNPKPFQEAIGQLAEYFAGKRREFDLTLSTAGSSFQQRVWKALRTVGYGKTASYGAIARMLGNPAASRAVGMANGRNPISIIVPCHRVIAADGGLGGYSGGLATKEWLLKHEAGRPAA